MTTYCIEWFPRENVTGYGARLVDGVPAVWDFMEGLPKDFVEKHDFQITQRDKNGFWRNVSAKFISKH